MQFKKQLEECQAKQEEYLNNWKRERADFLNYKNAESERIERMNNYIKEELAFKIIPIIDSFEMASKHIPEELKKDPNVSGLLQIKGQFLSFLKTFGIEEINPETDDFNPMIQEAVELVESEESGKVVEEIKKGYSLNGKVIRPSQVKVSK